MNPQGSIKAAPSDLMYIGLLFFFLFGLSAFTLIAWVHGNKAFQSWGYFFIFLGLALFFLGIPAGLLFTIKGIQIDNHGIQIHYPFRFKRYSYSRDDVKSFKETFTYTKGFKHEAIELCFINGDTYLFGIRQLSKFQEVKAFLLVNYPQQKV